MALCARTDYSFSVVVLAPLYTYESAFFKACDVCVFWSSFATAPGCGSSCVLSGVSGYFASEFKYMKRRIDIGFCHQHKTLVSQRIVGPKYSAFCGLTGTHALKAIESLFSVTPCVVQALAGVNN